jgi:hypothetical protein
MIHRAAMAREGTSGVLRSTLSGIRGTVIDAAGVRIVHEDIERAPWSGKI